MKEIFPIENTIILRENNPLSIQILVLSHGLESSGNSIPRNIQETNDLCSFKTFISKHRKICKCNLCEIYVKYLGYIAGDQLSSNSTICKFNHQLFVICKYYLCIVLLRILYLCLLQLVIISYNCINIYVGIATCI